MGAYRGIVACFVLVTWGVLASGGGFQGWVKILGFGFKVSGYFIRGLENSAPATAPSFS